MRVGGYADQLVRLCIWYTYRFVRLCDAPMHAGCNEITRVFKANGEPLVALTEREVASGSPLVNQNPKPECPIPKPETQAFNPEP